ncbi:acyltransferase family protein [Tardiphaga sp. 803_E3_N1_3]|uniref:acyltransferase family protein n=1 Tax=Tardiphaga sp. 803_E3_N1_3 TaxID=3240785 RepID=UPI003F20E0F4
MAERNIQLDGLRGIAALNVAIFHTILGIDENLIQRVVYGKFSDLTGPYDWFAKIVLKIFSGETAVFVFFVLSGTVLFQSLMRDRAPWLAASGTFVVRRAFRIYPALIGCLLFNVAVYTVIGQPITFYSFLINASLYDFPLNGVTWTLNVEMVGVAFVLLAYFGWRLTGLVGLAAAALLVWLFFRYSEIPLAITFKYFWFYFVVGMLIPTKIGETVARYTPPGATLLFVLFAIFFKSTVQQIAIGLLVMMIFYHRAGVLGVWLSAPLVQFLGRISYSLYLYNFVIFVYFCSYAKRFVWITDHPIEGGLLVSMFTVGATLPLAYLSMRFIEIPGIALGRVVTSRNKSIATRTA